MTYHIGDTVTGIVTGIQPYGAFVALDEKTQGLIHISECQTGYVPDIYQLLQVGQKVQVQILDIDEFNQKISLSRRTLAAKPILDHDFHYRKHYWTSRTVHTGFEPIAENLPTWISRALTELVRE